MVGAEADPTLEALPPSNQWSSQGGPVPLVLCGAPSHKRQVDLNILQIAFQRNGIGRKMNVQHRTSNVQ
jgi:hypothetical protein